MVEQTLREQMDKLRDHFAGLAMQGIISIHAENSYLSTDRIPEEAYKMADAMLKEREKKEDE